MALQPSTIRILCFFSARSQVCSASGSISVQPNNRWTGFYSMVMDWSWNAPCASVLGMSGMRSSPGLNRGCATLLRTCPESKNPRQRLHPHPAITHLGWSP